MPVEATEVIDELVERLETTGLPVHYAYLDMIVSGRTVDYPFIAVAPESDSEMPQGNDKKVKIDRVVTVVAVIERVRGDTIIPMQQLDTVLKNVRLALSFDEYDKPSDMKALKYTMGGAKFKLPDAGDEYVYFELDLTVTFMETR